MTWVTLTNRDLIDVFLRFKKPFDIQIYLDDIYYDGADINRTPLEVITQQRAHCLDGGIFAAAALRYLGYPPLVVDLVPAPKTDDDHVLAVFNRHGSWGAVAKSNYSGIRYREPVYRTIRELVMSYFEPYYSFNGKRTLRGYTRTMNLANWDVYKWWQSSSGMDKIVKNLYSRKSIPILNPEIIPELTKVDKRTYDAGMLGINLEGVYRPEDDDNFPTLIT